MENGYATLRCVLKVHLRCDACKRHTMEILGSIVGTYDITMDAERRTAMIVGQVEPNYCIRAITRCDGHAELVWANLSHPRTRGTSYGYGSSSYYDSFGESYGMWREDPTRSIPDYSYTANNINYDRRRRDPYYPLIDYTIPYHIEESMNLCSIL
ncbi:uncharacterized protein LOC131009400 [Salvia miltiorrhiza]|uniref:uncharacterized protein LOC131009400 n=1 Tax=Salvia miltiorrhiza TaxID=226208 RepID=UPI0025AC61C5|nr:uncharacterized protein LOC131009400 [Salvia miltiorrhiza]